MTFKTFKQEEEKGMIIYLILCVIYMYGECGGVRKQKKLALSLSLSSFFFLKELHHKKYLILHHLSGYLSM
ncbi:hypothetical protein OAV88_02310 [bacterium]|nr:hypothetical protein [bacterium]